MSLSFLQKKIMGLECTRLGESADAGLVSLSMPLPRECRADNYSVNDTAAYVEGLGRWPGGDADDHRRALIIADNDGIAPDRLRVSKQPDSPGDRTVPGASMQLMKRSPDRFFIWEQHALRINWGSSTIDLAMGIRTGGAIHWWEACRLVTLRDEPSCTVVEMGGAIPVEEYGVEVFQEHPSYTHPYLHKHNWINGHIYARLHANGVCEIFAHHINSKFADDGAAFDDVVPVIGLRVDGQDPAESSLLGDWDGETTEFKYGEVAFDMSEAAHLATSEQPGRIDAEDGLLVWQPYEGVDLYGGIYANTKTGDPYIFHSKDRHFPRGMSRTIRFRVSLNPDRSPRIARYLAPAWWYGACEEFCAGPYLPVSNEYDKLLDGYANCGKEYVHQGGFEDGNIPRGMSFLEGSDRPEPGWEGEAPYGLLLYAWRTGDADAYDTALRASWFFTDVIVDHAAKQVRMHGYAPNAFALPMARVLAPIGAWLETGDPYLIDTARAVVETAHWTEKNSWPRLAVGRDAGYFAAWHENSDARHGAGEIKGGDHSIAQALQYVPRLQAWLWKATVDETGIHASPVWVGESTPNKATLLGPDGHISVEWVGETVVSQDNSFSCKPQIL